MATQEPSLDQWMAFPDLWDAKSHLEKILVVQQIAKRLLRLSTKDTDETPPIVEQISNEDIDKTSLIECDESTTTIIGYGVQFAWESFDKAVRDETGGASTKLQKICEVALGLVSGKTYEMRVLILPISHKAKSNGQFDGDLQKMVENLNQTVDEVRSYEECKAYWTRGDQCLLAKNYSEAFELHQAAADSCPAALHLYLAKMQSSIALCHYNLNRWAKVLEVVPISIRHLDAVKEDYVPETEVPKIRIGCYKTRLIACLELENFNQATEDFVILLESEEIFAPVRNFTTKHDSISALEFAWAGSAVSDILSIAQSINKLVLRLKRTEPASKTDLIRSSLSFLEHLRISQDGNIVGWSDNNTEMSIWSYAYIIVILLSLAFIPLYRRHPKNKSLHKSLWLTLHQQPFEVVNFMVNSSLDTHIVEKRLSKIVEDAKKSLWRTATRYTEEEQFGRSTIIEYQIQIYVSEEYENIGTQFAEATDLLDTIRVHIDGFVDYAHLQKSGLDKGLNFAAARQCINQLFSRKKQYNKQYAAVFEPNSLTPKERLLQLRRLMNKEGKGVFEQYVCSLALWYRHISTWNEEAKREAFLIKSILQLVVSTADLQILNPQVAQLLERLTSQNVSDAEVPKLTGLVLVLNALHDVK